jgi:hypothetical protein
VIRVVALVFFSTVIGFNAFSQKTVINQSLYWLRYNAQLNITKKLYWNNDIEERRFFEHNRHHHLIIHSRLHYKIKKNTEAAAGITYSLQSPHDPDAISRLTVPEIRPVQQLTMVNKLNTRFAIEHRVRVDERFIRKNNGTELLPGYDFNFRFRYRLQANYRINKKENYRTPTVLKLANEVMFNAGRNIVHNKFDQNRIYFSVDQGIKPNVSVELGYIRWYQKRASGVEYFDRDIFRLSIHHKINLQ